MTRHIENARTLSSLLNITGEEAAVLLEASVSITVDEKDRIAAELARELAQLLSRTLATVDLNPPQHNSSAEIVIGQAEARTSRSLRVILDNTEIQIGGSAIPRSLPETVPPLIPLIAACYATGMALKAALGNGVEMPGPHPEDGIVIKIEDILGSDTSWMQSEVLLEDTYLAGAGAIGNAFIYALSHFHVSGSLVIADPDTVSDGNLNRCVWFQDEDLGLSKAVRLAVRAQPSLPNCRLLPEETTIQQLGKAREGAWLRRLIVAVDSRRARRRLQTEVPGEVFDASTTGVVECVFHHHKQPTALACLACVYSEVPDELAHERHIADLLGVDLESVKQHYITPDAAQKISQKYPDIPKNQLEEQAYDSLFKALCGEAKLKQDENRQVLAPFAFVSVLAGLFLAIEFARRLSLGDLAMSFNYFRWSPWAPPVPDLKQTWQRNSTCDFCSEPVLLATAARQWSK